MISDILMIKDERYILMGASITQRFKGDIVQLGKNVFTTDTHAYVTVIKSENQDNIGVTGSVKLSSLMAFEYPNNKSFKHMLKR